VISSPSALRFFSTLPLSIHSFYPGTEFSSPHKPEKDLSFVLDPELNYSVQSLSLCGVLLSQSEDVLFVLVSLHIGRLVAIGLSLFIFAV